jgi:hypothetical protein
MTLLIVFSVRFANPVFFLHSEIQRIREMRVSVAALHQSQISAA